MLCPRQYIEYLSHLHPFCWTGYYKRKGSLILSDEGLTTILDWILDFTQALSLYQKFFSYQKDRFYIENGSLCPPPPPCPHLLILLSVLMSSNWDGQGGRETRPRPDTEPVSSSMPPTRSAVMVQAQASYQNLFPYWQILVYFFRLVENKKHCTDRK